MTIELDNETGISFDFDWEETVKKTVLSALDYEDCPYECEVSVLLTDDQGIQEVNREMRGIDRATDVLSFPSAEYERPADFDGLEEQDVFNPETGEYMLGDILISAEKVKSQAQEYGHSEIRELAFLTAHSMLHLMGYDHEDEEERRIMEERQEAILQRIGITRE